MLAATLFFAAALAQAPSPATDCAAAMARSTSGATVQICLADAELGHAQTAVRDSLEWKQHMSAAVTLYKKALALPADELGERFERLDAVRLEPPC